MRTPEEIKLGLECCGSKLQCHACPYLDDCLYTHDDSIPMAKDALALICQLEAQVPRWIPMKEQLPPKGKYVIVMNGHGYVSMLALGAKDKSCWTWIGVGRIRHDNDITHWIPLPERPEED